MTLGLAALSVFLVWLAVLVFVLALCRVAGESDERMEHARDAGDPRV